jgi:hypothetical protein
MPFLNIDSEKPARSKFLDSFSDAAPFISSEEAAEATIESLRLDATDPIYAPSLLSLTPRILAAQVGAPVVEDEVFSGAARAMAQRLFEHLVIAALPVNRLR